MTFRTLWLISLLLLTGCSDYQWGWYVLDPSTEQGITNLKFLVAGFNDTIQVSLLSMCFAMTLGLLIALPALSRSPTLKWMNRIYVEVIRSIPV
ncbi:ABC transporter permease subunit, partial [Escherichia coli]|nr:ABC transporter permease subunit [Escherichia coli]